MVGGAGPIGDGGASGAVQEGVRRMAVQDTQTNEAGVQTMNDVNERFTRQLDHDRAALLTVSQAAAASLATASSAPSGSAPAAPSSAPEGGGYGPTGRGIDHGKGSSSGPTAKAGPMQRDTDASGRPVARSLGTAVNVMDAQAQARQ